MKALGKFAPNLAVPSQYATNVLARARCAWLATLQGGKSGRGDKDHGFAKYSEFFLKTEA